MKMTFLGAAHEVTGSCTLLTCCGQHGLVDCGMEQGRDIFENQDLPITPAQVDFVLLTTVEKAYDKQLDALFQDEAMDISADVTVLEQMMAQEGLTDNGQTL